MKERIADINPDCEVIALKCFIQKKHMSNFLNINLDFVVDASDTISIKFI